MIKDHIADVQNSWEIEFERGGVVRKIRGLVYRLGFRPKEGSIFRSPSLELLYVYRDSLKKK